MMENWAKQAKPIMQNMIHTDATPKLSKQVLATAAVVMGTKLSYKQQATHLMNVFVQPLQDVSSFTAPVYPKTKAEKNLIREALKANFIFATSSERELRTFIDAFEESDVTAGDKIIVEGNVGDYFYVLKKGKVRFEVNRKAVGYADEGKTFGELALLYSCPRAASVIAETDATIYRVDQKTFRYIMQSQTMKTEQAKKELLQGIDFLKILDPTDIDKLVDIMTPRVFEEGDCITKLGDEGDTLYVIQEGKVRVTEVNVHSIKKVNQELGPGDHFGETSLLHKEEDAKCSTFIAITEVLALCIDTDTFQKVVGDIVELATQSKEKAILADVPILKRSGLSKPIFAALAASFVEIRYPPKSTVMVEGEKTTANLYVVRAGKLVLKSQGEERLIESGGIFGEDMLKIDDEGLKTTAEYDSKHTVTTLDGSVVVGALSIESFRKVLDTTALGTKETRSKTDDNPILLEDLVRHTIIGAGTFGQVWLVSHSGEDKERRPYALKVQSKFELIRTHQAAVVVQEKKIMEALNHPFLTHLAATFQDKKFIYMLMNFVQGGELYSLLHSNTRDGMDENHAVFYAAGILDGLSHMHRHHILYRDLKPENVMIDEDGYPIVIDFGFAKYVKRKTYTLCGTPLYLAPEVILNHGHDRGADHWSFAVLAYEMIEGTTPFYRPGLDQIQLFRRICRVRYSFPGDSGASPEARDLVGLLLVLDPSQRLGALAGGINEIYAHPWFGGIDFGKLRQKEVTAPWVPAVADPLDTANFENWDHLEDQTTKGASVPVVSSEQQRIFESF